MEAEFWHQKWESGDIGFHQSQVNAFLRGNLERVGPAAGNRWFLPLCGMTLDISWLLDRGFRVAGVELSELAVAALFDSLGLEPDVTVAGTLKRHSAQDIDIFVGDIFDLSSDQLGPVDAIYDRAALVALPPALRAKYAPHMATLGGSAPQLLISFEYDQSIMAGPPFAVFGDEIRQLYGENYRLEPLERRAVEGGLKGLVEAMETVWLLQSRQ